MEDKKLCPLKQNALFEEERNCDGEKCGWWAGKQCAVVVLCGKSNGLLDTLRQAL